MTHLQSSEFLIPTFRAQIKLTKNNAKKNQDKPTFKISHLIFKTSSFRAIRERPRVLLRFVLLQD